MAALAHRGQEYIVDFAGLVRGNFVADCDLHIQPIERLGVRTDWPEVGARPFLPDRVCQRFNAIATADLWCSSDHLPRRVEQDPSLVAGNSRSVAFSATLAIEETEIQRQRCSKGRL